MRRATEVAKPILDDELWALIEPLLPPPKRRRKRYSGRKPIANRRTLTGILYVLRSGVPWNLLPKEMGCGSGMTCWRRLRAWHTRGVWQRVHEVLLSKLREADKLDFTRAVVDSSSVRAAHGGKKLDRTQPIAARRVRSTTSSLKLKAFR
jgi:transposase